MLLSWASELHDGGDGHTARQHNHQPIKAKQMLRDRLDKKATELLLELLLFQSSIARAMDVKKHAKNNDTIRATSSSLVASAIRIHTHVFLAPRLPRGRRQHIISCHDVVLSSSSSSSIESIRTSVLSQTYCLKKLMTSSEAKRLDA